MALNRQTGIIGGALALAAGTVTMFALLGGATRVAPGESLQAAINSAQCGAVIEVDAGAVYDANITLPKKDCTEFITIQSSRAGELPQGQRIDPTVHGSLLAKLQSVVNAEPVIQTAAGAHHYKFIGVEISTRDEGVFVYDLVRFGGGRQEQATPESVPHHLVIDRSYIHGTRDQHTQRAVTLNCADCQVVNSYISNIKAPGMDTQAVCGWNGTLRAQVMNSYLEAAGENVMFGGADPASEQLNPTLIEVRRNHIRKPMEWKGKGYTIKNLVELKNCVGCTVDANTIENNWGGEGQSGIGVLATVRNQEGSAPYSVIENFIFTNNIVKNMVGALNFLGTDNEQPSRKSRGALVRNNIFEQSGAFITISGFDDVIIENNTHLQTCTEGCNTIVFYGQEVSNGFIYRNNVTQEKPYGIRDENGVEGVTALEQRAPGYVMTGNVIATPYTKNPPGNEYPASLTITSDYRTPYAGKGADVDAILAAMAGTGPSQPTPTLPTPSPSVTASVTVSPSPTPIPSPSPSATSTPAPLPTATAQPTATPRPSPVVSPSPIASPLPFCRSGERPGNPPRCRCRFGFQGNSGKCR